MIVAGIVGIIFGAVAAIGTQEKDNYAYDHRKGQEHSIDPAEVDDIALANDRCNRHDSGRIDALREAVDPQFTQDPDYVRGWKNGADEKRQYRGASAPWGGRLFC